MLAASFSLFILIVKKTKVRCKTARSGSDETMKNRLKVRKENASRGPPSLKEEVWYVSEENGVCTAAPSEAMLMLKSCLCIQIDLAHDRRWRAASQVAVVLQETRRLGATCAYILTTALLFHPRPPPTGTLTQWTSARSTRTGRRWGCRAASPARRAGRSPSQPSRCSRGRRWSLPFFRREAGKQNGRQHIFLVQWMEHEE